MNVIQTENLTKFFGNQPSLRKINLTIQAGGTIALLGRNGAGKTTLLRTILGFEEPTSGYASVLGYDSLKIPVQERAKIGYLTEDHTLYSWMKVDECVAFQASCFPHWDWGLCNQTIEQFQIDRATKIKNLSRGQRAGLCLSLVLAPNPDLIILDDPSLGLDIVAKRAMLEALVELSAQPEKTLVLSTHLIDELERLADHIVLIKNGALSASCPLETFQQEVSIWSVSLEHLPSNWREIPGLIHSKKTEDELQLTLKGSHDECYERLKKYQFRNPRRLNVNVEKILSNYLE